MPTQKLLAPWQIALNELRVKQKVSYEQIATDLSVSVKSVSRLFSGEAKKPDFFFVSQIIHYLKGSVSEILGEGGAYIVNQDIATLQAQYDELKTRYDALETENQALKEKNAALTDELLDVVNYFIKIDKKALSEDRHKT
jgi:transcriptional regulator with XRE-family HTH domain